MRFNTERYTVRKLSEADGFSEDVAYEISLKDGYYFADDNSGISYAEDYEDLLYLISTIRKS